MSAVLPVADEVPVEVDAPTAAVKAAAGGFSAKGQDLIAAWLQARDAKVSATDAMNTASAAEAEAREALAAWVAPDDAKIGETFSVVAGKALIQVLWMNTGSTITLRTRERAES
jgi:hypothetical protein